MFAPRQHMMEPFMQPQSVLGEICTGVAYTVAGTSTSFFTFAFGGAKSLNIALRIRMSSVVTFHSESDLNRKYVAHSHLNVVN